ncbi:hypothetical protein NPIL_231921 [Nephila pilipes]|uniref:Uncharacterized protein n=1 Tax=Nephila pilipes TaxID=299642 RepID=A0A8X6U965_NEPPI|nr:hypothetical protein NPIL_169471 [Nephila pilipes]GFU24481.1 hypothetical protein NPIL_482401 [Nephila pilipes]GFU30218.1 hypothetical protein NPIL_231921 [Nephila pilipes]
MRISRGLPTLGQEHAQFIREDLSSSESSGRTGLRKGTRLIIGDAITQTTAINSFGRFIIRSCVTSRTFSGDKRKGTMKYRRVFPQH